MPGYFMRSVALFTVSAACISASAAEAVAVDAQQRASLLAFYAQQYPGEPAARKSADMPIDKVSSASPSAFNCSYSARSCAKAAR